MDKKEFNIKIAKRLGVTIADAKIITDTVLDSIAEVLSDNENLCFSKFGTFKLIYQGTRPVRNPKSGEPYMLEPRMTVRFSCGKQLKERINEHMRKP